MSKIVKCDVCGIEHAPLEMEQITRTHSLRGERYFDICIPCSGQMFKDVKNYQMFLTAAST